ncbi:glycosyltransferase family 4 protein [candidate division KSB1 bacterium]|nr:glycosyltransferase family 4 protein [candidate division KSB1 bacterium]
MKNHRKINIAHIVVSLDTGGLENGIINLINNKINKQISYYVICLKKPGVQASKIFPHSATIISLENNYTGLLTGIFKIRKIYKKYKIQIAHAHGWGQGSLTAVLGAKLAGVKIIINGEHGTFFLHTKAAIFGQKFVSYFCNRILAVSDSLKKSTIKNLGISAHKITVIPNGVDTKKFSITVDVEKKKNDLCLSPHLLTIGTVGRLVEVKNQALVLKAIKYIKENGTPVQCVIVGEGPLREKLTQMIIEYNIQDFVYLVGERKDVNEIMHTFDVFVLTSHSEGMSNTVLEAMAAGLPVVCTNVGANSQLVVDGQTGLLVKKNNLKDFTQRLHILLTNNELRQVYSRNALNSVSKYYSIEKMVQTYEKLYFHHKQYN